MQHAAPHQDGKSAEPGLRAGLGHTVHRLGDIARQLPRPSYAHLGWAFLLAWVFCTFYLHSISWSLAGSTEASYDASSSLVGDLVHSGAPLAISVLVLVVIVAFESRTGSLSSRPAWQFACPAAAALGTLLMCVPGVSGLAGEVFFWGGAFLTGIGSAPLWVMWGELYAQLEQGVTEMSSSISAVVAALLALICASLTGWIALLVVALLPIASGIALFRAARGSTPGKEAAPSRADQPSGVSVPAFIHSFGREGQGILVASAVICYAGCFVPDMVPLGVTQLALVGAAALACVIAGMGILTPRRFNLQFLYRWMCPFVLASLACPVWFGPGVGGNLSFMGSIGARLAFCLLTQVYFSHVCVEGHMTPTRIFGLGWICLHLGDLVGVTLNIVILHVAPQLAASSGCILALALIMVASVMFTLNGRTSFAQTSSPSPADYHAAAAHGQDCAIAKEDAAAKPGPSKTAPTARHDVPADVDAIDLRCAELAEGHGLTAREREVLVLLAHGRSNPYIRDALTISLDTAGTHVKHVYAKLGVHSRQELIDLVRDPLA
ncbi:MAG: helix-turn-helix transcriptional regulator [Coriobacteriia bacterium]|nr:helix-turn-helix transcriptional regulator [Coriobacteriia bacterium]MBS5477831.1 helix-turn-helix transcriptional regulator [Coriobacteriia bacterium]